MFFSSNSDRYNDLLTMVHFLFDEYKSIAANGLSGKPVLSAMRFALCRWLIIDPDPTLIGERNHLC